jgi:hypothetical protein
MNIALVELVWQRAARRCEYRQMPQDCDELLFEIDHIVAEQHGGKTVAGNLALACFSDNHHKGPNLAGVDPSTRRRTWLYNPRRHKWARHFRWDGPILIGRTAIGRATIAVLGINLPHRVRHRTQLIAEGVFPFEAPTRTS